MTASGLMNVASPAVSNASTASPGYSRLNFQQILSGSPLIDWAISRFFA